MLKIWVDSRGVCPGEVNMGEPCLSENVPLVHVASGCPGGVWRDNS